MARHETVSGYGRERFRGAEHKEATIIPVKGDALLHMFVPQAARYYVQGMVPDLSSRWPKRVLSPNDPRAVALHLPRGSEALVTVVQDGNPHYLSVRSIREPERESGRPPQVAGVQAVKVYTGREIVVNRRADGARLVHIDEPVTATSFDVKWSLDPDGREQEVLPGFPVRCLFFNKKTIMPLSPIPHVPAYPDEL